MTDLDHKVLEACHRIEDLYHETDGKCYISFSGGKDSTVLLAITKLCAEAYTIPGEGIRAVFCNTGIEMGVTVDFVNRCKAEYYQNIEIIRPEHYFDWCVRNYGKPLISKVKSEFIHRYKIGNRSDCTMRNLVYGKSRSGKTATRTMLADRDFHILHEDFRIPVSPMCCSVLKKKPFLKYAKINGINGVALGIRSGEGGVRVLSQFRREEDQGRICTSISPQGFIKKYPLIDWTDEEIDEFIEKYNVPISDAYTKYGFVRTGCMACPFAQDVNHSLTYLFKYEPNRYKAIMHWLKDVYIAQNVILPFDLDYERERGNMAGEISADAKRDASQVQTGFTADPR